MHKHDRIYIAGHRGLAGSALLRGLQRRGYETLITRTHAELDLTDQQATRRFFAEEAPEVVFMAAGRVGGIHANNTYRAEFIYQNLMMEANIVHEAWRAGVKRLLFLGSSCIYPRECPQPIRESYLLSAPLEPTSEPYAVAKIAGVKLCQAYNAQYGTRYVGVMPSNLYGINDNYDLQNSHVLPALIRKAHNAKRAGEAHFGVWGSGRQKRELLFADDMADACILLMEKDAPGDLFNIGMEEDITIGDLARLVAKTVGFAGGIAWDTSKPDGPMQKLLDVSQMHALGWQPRTSLAEGIALAYADFKQRFPDADHAA